MKRTGELNIQSEYEPPTEFFRRMRVIRSTLEKFGFKKESGVWTYSAPIANGALVARLTADKVGGNRKDIVEAVNLRRTDSMDGPRFLPAYHMNKKTWTTTVLDETISVEELKRFLTASRDKAI